MRLETGKAMMRTGKSDLFGMHEEMGKGLWNDPLMDPET